MDLGPACCQCAFLAGAPPNRLPPAKRSCTARRPQSAAVAVEASGFFPNVTPHGIRNSPRGNFQRNRPRPAKLKIIPHTPRQNFTVRRGNITPLELCGFPCRGPETQQSADSPVPSDLGKNAKTITISCRSSVGWRKEWIISRRSLGPIRWESRP